MRARIEIPKGWRRVVGRVKTGDRWFRETDWTWVLVGGHSKLAGENSNTSWVVYIRRVKAAKGVRT